MDNALLKLKEALEAGAEARRHEAMALQKLAQAVEAFAVNQKQDRPSPAAEKLPTLPHKQTFLTTAQAAEFLGISPKTMDVWRVRGGGPSFTKIGRLVRYDIGELENFAKKNVYPHTSAYDLKR